MEEKDLSIWEVDKLLLFIAFIIPGFVSLKVFELLYPSDVRDSSKSIIDALTYSCINYSILLVPVWFLSDSIDFQKLEHIFALSVIALLFLPIVTSLVYCKVRTTDFIQSKAPHPTKVPWDFVFGQRKWYWVLVELVDGKKIGGLYASDSFASNYPAPEQIYLEECWHIDEEDTFERQRTGTAGILIMSSQIKTIEFFNYSNEGSETGND